MKRTVLAALVLVVAVVSGFLVGGRSPGHADAASTPVDTAGVVVDGVGEVTGTPNALTVSMGIVATGADVNQTLNRANAQIARIDASLLAHGAKKEDLQTSNVSVYPMDIKRVRRYQVSEQLTAKLRDIKRSGAAISAAVAAGGAGVTLDGVSFSLEGDTALLDQAREKAFADARRKAEAYARLSGARLGKVQLIAETVQSPQVYADRQLLSSGSSAKAAEVPIYTGSSQLNVRVTIRWALS